MLKNQLTRQLQIKYPIVQAPMAGGVTTSELVAAVSHNGGLGMIGAGYMTPTQIQEQILEIKQLTKKPFGINLFIPSEFNVSQEKINEAIQILKPYREELNISDQHEITIDPNKPLKIFEDQIEIVLKEKVPVCSFTFGIPSKDVIHELKKHDVRVVGTATTVKEAILNEQAGMDAIVVQGSEAGGHRGTFTDEEHGSLIGLSSLIPQVADHVNLPIIGAGGIMEGRGVSAALCLGAQGVQMGTAFLTCVESGASEIHKKAILNASDDQTVMTRVFSGKWARGIHNRFIDEMHKYEQVIPQFPVQNELTKEIRKAATIRGNTDLMSLWSGQGVRLAKKQTVKELIDNIVEEGNF